MPPELRIPTDSQTIPKTVGMIGTQLCQKTRNRRSKDSHGSLGFWEWLGMQVPDLRRAIPNAGGPLGPRREAGRSEWERMRTTLDLMTSRATPAAPARRARRDLPRADTGLTQGEQRL